MEDNREENAIEEVAEAPEVNFLAMSDEEAANYVEPEERLVEAASEDVVENVNETEEPLVDEPEANAEGEKDSDTESEQEKKEPDVESPTDIDYKAGYEELLAPFRANNKDMKVDSIEDARTLMKMGANYNKKMSALKPNLKLMKMLENNKLLDETKLSYLIDLSKGSPEAIAKLVKESEVDPLRLEDNAEYKPNTYTVDDTQVELDSVIEDIRDSGSFTATMDIVNNKWDEPSREILLESPGILKVINEHVESGIYQNIMSVVDRERALNRLEGLSDLQAYKQVGDAMQANQKVTKPVASTVIANEEFVAPVKKTVTDPTLTKRRNAASSTSSVVKSGVGNQEYNPLALSDEDFEKQFNNSLM